MVGWCGDFLNFVDEFAVSLTKLGSAFNGVSTKAEILSIVLALWKMFC